MTDSSPNSGAPRMRAPVSVSGDRGRRLALRRAAASVGLALAVAATAPTIAVSQDAGRTQVSGAITRRLQHMAPNSGPAGSMVTVSTDQNTMPYITPVRLGVGALRVGFETLAELETSLQGNFSVPVTLPDWVSPDRSVRFVLFDFYFNPIAMSDAFYVTDANGELRREGQVIAGSKEGCLILSDRDGDFYTLEGGPTPLKAGDKVFVRAKLGEPGSCGAQPTLRVVDAVVRVP